MMKQENGIFIDRCNPKKEKWDDVIYYTVYNIENIKKVLKLYVMLFEKQELFLANHDMKNILKEECKFQRPSTDEFIKYLVDFDTNIRYKFKVKIPKYHYTAIDNEKANAYKCWALFFDTSKIYNILNELTTKNAKLSKYEMQLCNTIYESCQHNYWGLKLKED